MILTADYHTHTKYSHGKGTVSENAAVAEEKGLKEIAINDHGFSHPAFGIRPRMLSKMRADIDAVNESVRPKVIMGVESNLLGESGAIDVKPKYYEYFDTISVGFHKFIKYESVKDWFVFLGKNFCTQAFKKTPSDKLIQMNTKAYIRAIEKNPIDIITHINFGVFSDAVEVAKAARDNGVYLELNAKKTHLTDEELYHVAQTGVRFVIGSDAHSPDRVGEISLVEKLLDRVSISREQIDNIDGRLPVLRFQAYKREHGIGR